MVARTAASSFDTELVHLRAFVARLRSRISLPDLGSGRWFEEVLRAFLEHQRAHPPPARAERAGAARRHRMEAFEGEDPAVVAKAIIRRASIESALLGGGAAVVSSEASVLSAETEGAMAVVAFPIAGAAVVADMIGRAVAQLVMWRRLGELHGARLDEAELEDFLRLSALGFRTEHHRRDPGLGRDLVDRLVDVGEGGAEAIGSRLLGESVVRNAVPFLGVVTSTVGSYRLTAQLGRFLDRYFAQKRAIVDVLRRTEARWPELRDLLVEGVWFVYVADGKLTREESAVLAGFVHRRPGGAERFTRRFVSDRSGWLARLRDVDDEDARHTLFEGFSKAAMADAKLDPAERGVLERAAEALRVPYETHRSRWGQAASPAGREVGRNLH